MILKHLICTLKVEMRQHAQARTICPANNYNLWRHLIGISNFLWPYRIQIQIQLIIFVFGFPNYKHVRWAMNAAGSNGWLRHFEKFARWQAKHKNKFCLNDGKNESSRSWPRGKEGKYAKNQNININKHANCSWDWEREREGQMDSRMPQAICICQTNSQMDVGTTNLLVIQIRNVSCELQ